MTTCKVRIVKTVSAAISKTSQPLQTGSRSGGCGGKKACGGIAESVSAAIGAHAGVSLFSRGCEAYCGLLDEDRESSSGAIKPAFLLATCGAARIRALSNQ